MRLCYLVCHLSICEGHVYCCFRKFVTVFCIIAAVIKFLLQILADAFSRIITPPNKKWNIYIYTLWIYVGIFISPELEGMEEFYSHYLKILPITAFVRRI
jgi:hypothetical protein